MYFRITAFRHGKSSKQQKYGEILGAHPSTLAQKGDGKGEKKSEKQLERADSVESSFKNLPRCSSEADVTTECAASFSLTSECSTTTCTALVHTHKQHGHPHGN